MAERTGDTGFMLEWRFFAEGCHKIVVFVMSKAENWNIIWGIVEEVCVCANARGAVCVFAHFMSLHVTHMC